MEVLSFKSANVEITANTAADMANCWRRFRARVGDKADTYCDYRSTLPGNLELALYSDRFALRALSVNPTAANGSIRLPFFTKPPHTTSAFTSPMLIPLPAYCIS